MPCPFPLAHGDSTVAAACAGASLTPSPTIATPSPLFRTALIRCNFSSGISPASISLIPIGFRSHQALDKIFESYQRSWGCNPTREELYYLIDFYLLGKRSERAGYLPGMDIEERQNAINRIKEKMKQRSFYKGPPDQSGGFFLNG
jgi:hypothetical protein